MDTSVPGAGPNALLQLLADGEARAILALPGLLGLKPRSAYSSAYCLIRRDYARRDAEGAVVITEAGQAAVAAGKLITSGPKKGYGLGLKRRYEDMFRGRAWLSMRVRQVFTIGEVAADAERAGDTNARENARRYIGQLRSADYVAEFARRRPDAKFGSNGLKQFLLKKNTGPRPPIYRAERRALHDPNTGEDVPCAPR